jgi:hypothetical protein
LKATFSFLDEEFSNPSNILMAGARLDVILTYVPKHKIRKQSESHNGNGVNIASGALKILRSPSIVAIQCAQEMFVGGGVDFL